MHFPNAKEKPVPTPKKASKPKELGRKDQTARNKDLKTAKAKAAPKKMEKPKPKPPPKVKQVVFFFGGELDRIGGTEDIWGLGIWKVRHCTSN